MKAAKRAYREAKRVLETLKTEGKCSAEITAAKETFKKLKAAYKALKRGDEHGTKRKRDESSSSSTSRKVKTFEDFSEFSCFKSEWNFARLSEIQAASWPTVLKGQDVVCCKDGVRENLGFPVLFRIKDDRFSHDEAAHHSTSQPASVIPPTRELAIQIHNEAVRFEKAWAFGPSWYTAAHHATTKLTVEGWGERAPLLGPGRPGTARFHRAGSCRSRFAWP